MKKVARDWMQAVLDKSTQAPQEGTAADAERQLDVGKLKTKLKYAIAAMQKGLIERDVEVRLLLLAALSQEHMLYIGPPGTAKSEVGRRLSKIINGTYFERMLTRFSVPEELFGPLSMRALEEDKYLRQTHGYLPDADIAFVDEIFKANSAILNTLLTLLNERLFDNGSKRVKVPLITMVGASNELPESEELDALYDRFLLRKGVVQCTPQGLVSLLEYYGSTGPKYGSTDEDGGSSSSNGRGAYGLMDDIPEDMKITAQDFASIRQQAQQAVTVPASVINILADARQYLQDTMEPPLYVSDRRMVKALALLKVAAYCDGRNHVSEYDCLLLEHVLWNKPEQADRVRTWLVKQLSSDDNIQSMRKLLQWHFGNACRALGMPDSVAKLIAEVETLREIAAEKLMRINLNAQGRLPVVVDNLWLDDAQAEQLNTELAPKLRKTREELQTFLYDVVLLEVALRENCDAVMLANLLPKNWADFIRNAPMEDVKPMGTRPIL